MVSRRLCFEDDDGISQPSPPPLALLLPAPPRDDSFQIHFAVSTTMTASS